MLAILLLLLAAGTRSGRGLATLVIDTSDLAREQDLEDATAARAIDTQDGPASTRQPLAGGALHRQPASGRRCRPWEDG